ncbi:Protein Ves [Xanthomonas sacchari]|nr:Protein Ves [Xanthomonas sacchari]
MFFWGAMALSRRLFGLAKDRPLALIVQNARMDWCTLPARVIPANEYRRERWRNGLGWTREILRLPAAGDDWVLRLSIAEIEQDAAFSAFPGIDRELVLLRGNGVRLRFDDGEEQVLQDPCARLRFAGERPLRGELLDGPTHDFNLMWRRDRLRTQLLHRPLVGPMLFFAEPAVAWAVHLLAGQAQFDAASGLPPLAAGDSAWLAADARRRFALSGGGEVLAMRIEALPTPAD